MKMKRKKKFRRKKIIKRLKQNPISLLILVLILIIFIKLNVSLMSNIIIRILVKIQE